MHKHIWDVIKGVFVYLDIPQMQAQAVQCGLFVCLEGIWAQPACYLKHPRARPRGNAHPLRFSRARRDHFGRSQARSLVSLVTWIFPPTSHLPARVHLPYNGGCSSLFSSPPRSSLPPTLHSRCGCLILPRLAVHGGSAVIDGPHEARVGCNSSVSPMHGWWWSSSSSSSLRRASGAAGGCVCLPGPGPMVDAASSSPSHRLLPL
jgi:hypothetical protein